MDYSKKTPETVKALGRHVSRVLNQKYPNLSIRKTYRTGWMGFRIMQDEYDNVLPYLTNIFKCSETAQRFGLVKGVYVYVLKLQKDGVETTEVMIFDRTFISEQKRLKIATKKHMVDGRMAWPIYGNEQ